MATKNNPGAFDCYANAHPDEPMFVLLARDKHAPCLIWLWATLRELDHEDPVKVAEARACVDAMLEWQANNGRDSVGLGQAGLAAMFELIRSANWGLKEAKNVPTGDDVARLFLSQADVKLAEPPAEALDRLFDPARMPAREDGWAHHPDIDNMLAEGADGEDLPIDEAKVKAAGFELTYRSMAADVLDSHPAHQEYWDDGRGCSLWEPVAPEGIDWQLVAIYDTDEGPYALFARPVQS